MGEKKEEERVECFPPPKVTEDKHSNPPHHTIIILCFLVFGIECEAYVGGSFFPALQSMILAR